MLERLARCSRTLALPLAAALCAAAVPACSTQGTDETVADDDAVKNVQIGADDLDGLAAGQKVTVDLNASGVVYHFRFDRELDFGRIVLSFGAGGQIAMDEAMEPLFQHPYSPLQASGQRFILTGTPENFTELTAEDIDALRTEGMITREHRSGTPQAQPQSVNDCVEQTIYFYVSVTINGEVQQILCSHTILVCDNNATCEKRSYAGHDYLFCDSAKSWADAESFCAGQGSDLVTLNSAAEETFVYANANPISTQKWWIGLNDRASEGTFVWESGEPVTYANWYAWEPNNAGGNEDCTQLNRFYPSTGWNDEPCSLHFRFICESN